MRDHRRRYHARRGAFTQGHPNLATRPIARHSITVAARTSEVVRRKGTQRPGDAAIIPTAPHPRAVSNA
jgi:hypothetical protein